MSEKKIAIYDDEGVSSFSKDCLVKAFKDLNLNVKLLSSKDVLISDWEQDTSIFVMPGGRDLFYQKKLTSLGNQKIRKFVEGGGSYLGICAGAYYGSSYIEFSKDSELEVVGKRELGFTQAIAKGPVYEKDSFRYDSFHGSIATLVDYEKELSGYLFFKGGCYFDNVDEKNVIGKYSDLKKAAIIECKVGRGKAILSGVHFESSYEDFDENKSYYKNLISSISKTESIRKKIFKNIIQKLI